MLDGVDGYGLSCLLGLPLELRDLRCARKKLFFTGGSAAGGWATGKQTIEA